MIKGLEHFKKHFSVLSDHYVLIGGSACAIIMEEVGLDFRATKDLDIVLYVEALTAEFAIAFWKFIKAGGYQNKLQSTGKQIFYRFNSPRDDSYPFMLELFSRVPDAVTLSFGSHLTPIPINEAISSLSAILLDDDYYRFIHEGKILINGLSVLSATHLIPLKARAWLDLKERRNMGADIDDKDIRKHRNDVIRLHQLLIPTERISLPQTIKGDMRSFLEYLQTENSIDFKNLGLKNFRSEEMCKNLKNIYSI